MLHVEKKVRLLIVSMRRMHHASVRRCVANLRFRIFSLSLSSVSNRRSLHYDDSPSNAICELCGCIYSNSTLYIASLCVSLARNQWKSTANICSMRFARSEYQLPITFLLLLCSNSYCFISLRQHQLISIGKKQHIDWWSFNQTHVQSIGRSLRRHTHTREHNVVATWNTFFFPENYLLFDCELRADVFFIVSSLFLLGIDARTIKINNEKMHRVCVLTNGARCCWDTKNAARAHARLKMSVIDFDDLFCF